MAAAAGVVSRQSLRSWRLAAGGWRLAWPESWPSSRLACVGLKESNGLIVKLGSGRSQKRRHARAVMLEATQSENSKGVSKRKTNPTESHAKQSQAKKTKKKVDTTPWCSRVVPYRSTDQAQ